jgi:hypothetical protein
MLAPESLEKTRTRLEDVVPLDEHVVLREHVGGKFHRVTSNVSFKPWGEETLDHPHDRSHPGLGGRCRRPSSRRLRGNQRVEVCR